MSQFFFDDDLRLPVLVGNVSIYKVPYTNKHTLTNLSLASLLKPSRKLCSSAAFCFYFWFWFFFAKSQPGPPTQVY